MWVWLLTGGLAVWLLLAFLVLCICRAASRADENDDGRRFVRGKRSKTTASVALAVVVLPAVPTKDADAAACANRDVQFDTSPALMREAVLCEIERARSRRDAGRVRGNGQLALAASRHAADMYQRKYFSHVSPGGSDLADRVRRAGYAKPRCSWRVGEILAWGVGNRSTAAATVRAWLDSPSHRQILLSERYSHVGIGIEAGTPFAEYPGGATAAAVFGARDCSS